MTDRNHLAGSPLSPRQPNAPAGRSIRDRAREEADTELTPKQREAVIVLNDVLKREYEVVDLYQRATLTAPTEAQRALLHDLFAEHELCAGRLREAVRTVGGTPAPPRYWRRLRAHAQIALARGRRARSARSTTKLCRTLEAAEAKLSDAHWRARPHVAHGEVLATLRRGAEASHTRRRTLRRRLSPSQQRGSPG